MHLPSLSPSRLASVAVLACAAALVPVAAMAGTASPARPSGPPECTTAGLVVWMDTQGDGYAGGVEYLLHFTNLSGRACTMTGHPGVSAVSLSGKQVGSPAGWPTSTPVTITLAEGASATATLQVTDPGNYGTSCLLRKSSPGLGQKGKLPLAAGLRVYPPNQYTSKVVPFPLQACANTGPVWLHAGPVLG
jgi:Protein of unknown function (DUF4232)